MTQVCLDLSAAVAARNIREAAGKQWNSDANVGRNMDHGLKHFPSIKQPVEVKMNFKKCVTGLTSGICLARSVRIHVHVVDRVRQLDKVNNL